MAQSDVDRNEPVAADRAREEDAICDEAVAREECRLDRSSSLVNADLEIGGFNEKPKNNNEEDEGEEEEDVSRTEQNRKMAPITKEWKQSRQNELGLHEQWRQIHRTERMKTREERKERNEIAKERLVDRLDETTEKFDRELDVAEKQTRAMANAHLETAEKIIEAAIKCKARMREDLEQSMLRAFAAFAKETEAVKKAHAERMEKAEKALNDLKIRFESKETNVHFPRHASTMAEIKNQAEEERANLRSTVGSKLQFLKREVKRALGKDDDDDDDDDEDDNNSANDDYDETISSAFLYSNNHQACCVDDEDNDHHKKNNNEYRLHRHPKIAHQHYRRINRIEDAKLTRAEHTLQKLTSEREKWQRKTRALETKGIEDSAKIETQTRDALARARVMRELRAQRSKKYLHSIKQKLRADSLERNGNDDFRIKTGRSDLFWQQRERFHEHLRAVKPSS